MMIVVFTVVFLPAETVPCLLSRLSRVVDFSSLQGVVKKNLRCKFSFDIAYGSYSSLLQLASPSLHFWSFIKADSSRIRIASAGNHPSHSGPGNCAETHRAWFYAGYELVSREVVPAKVIAKCGYVFRSSENITEDMIYNGALSGINRIRHMDHSSVIGKVAVIPDNSWSENDKDLELQVFDYEYLRFEKRITLPRFLVGTNAFYGHGRFVFYNNNSNKLFVILQADGSSGLLYDYGVVVY